MNRESCETTISARSAPPIRPPKEFLDFSGVCRPSIHEAKNVCRDATADVEARDLLADFDHIAGAVQDGHHGFGVAAVVVATNNHEIAIVERDRTNAYAYFEGARCGQGAFDRDDAVEVAARVDVISVA